MVEHSNIQKESRTVVSFNIKRELGLRFQAQCQAQGTTPTEVLTEFIGFYLEATPTSPTATPGENITSLIEEYILTKIEHYLQYQLNAKISGYVEHYLNLRFQNLAENPITPGIDNPVESSDLSLITLASSEELASSEDPVELNLKSAKELAKILGVSAPYITTLNRIGELSTWGWEDSGQRRGKTILYQPIQSTS